MKQVTNNGESRLITSELPFQLATEIKDWLACGLDDFSAGVKCLVILPDQFIDHLSLLAFVTLRRVGLKENHLWEIRDILLYQVVEQGQSTELAGIIDGESSDFDQISAGFFRENLIHQWQVSMVMGIKYKRIDDESSFTSQHLTLLRSTGIAMVDKFEEQKPDLCGLIYCHF